MTVHRMLDVPGGRIHAVEQGERTATIVGHDRGSPIAPRPDVFTAAALLSVPFSPRGGPRPTELAPRPGQRAPLAWLARS